MAATLSRRDFLKWLGAAAGGLTFSTLTLPTALAAGSTPQQGRVAYNKVKVYDAPNTSGEVLKTLKFDELIQISKTVTGGAPGDVNRSWYQLSDAGYAHSAGIQPVASFLNKPVYDIPEKGALAEITVPFTDSRWKPTELSRRGYRLYYETTYWVHAIFEDEKGQPWYRIYDDIMKLVFFVRAEHVRIIPPEELTPLSLDVPAEQKVIVISLSEQRLIAAEGDQIMLDAKISSGVGRRPTHYASTPLGEFRTFFKRPAGHMTGGDGVSSFYDLPGVPWSTYLNQHGISIHGTYWHNDYGTRRSHGCINLPPAQARWVYRWTNPVVLPEEKQVYLPGTGTRVYVIEQPIFQRRS